MQPCSLGQFLLREPALVAKLSHRGAESILYREERSLSNTWIVTTMSLHTMSVIIERARVAMEISATAREKCGLTLRCSQESGGSPSAIAQ